MIKEHMDNMVGCCFQFNIYEWLCDVRNLFFFFFHLETGYSIKASILLDWNTKYPVYAGYYIPRIIWFESCTNSFE